MGTCQLWWVVRILITREIFVQYSTLQDNEDILATWYLSETWTFTAALSNYVWLLAGFYTVHQNRRGHPTVLTWHAFPFFLQTNKRILIENCISRIRHSFEKTMNLSTRFYSFILIISTLIFWSVLLYLN
jgi:hypothetical protein